MRLLLGFVVGITLLALPLATLVVQLRVLAYQDQAVTWAQRVAVWFDVALVSVPVGTVRAKDTRRGE